MVNIQLLIKMIKHNLISRGLKSDGLENFIRRRIEELRNEYSDNTEFIQEVAKLNLLEQKDVISL